jgi:hypothetical protein
MIEPDLKVSPVTGAQRDQGERSYGLSHISARCLPRRKVIRLACLVEVHTWDVGDNDHSRVCVLKQLRHKARVLPVMEGKALPLLALMFAEHLEHDQFAIAVGIRDPVCHALPGLLYVTSVVFWMCSDIGIDLGQCFLCELRGFIIRHKSTGRLPGDAGRRILSPLVRHRPLHLLIAALYPILCWAQELD